MPNESPEQSGQFLKYLNFGTISLFKAAEILDPRLTIEKFIERTGALIRGVVRQEIFLEDIRWHEVREQTKKILNQ